MCGISAIVDPVGVIPRTSVDDMIRALQHRGPDATGVAEFDACSLGHARLSVIDLEGGAQPMRDTSGRYAITFNGEIYNYKAVRQRLEAQGVHFVTSSDTEVILAGYRYWGTRILHELIGMFAFVIWDNIKREVFAARDPFGEKPLYYAVPPAGGLIVASEIRAILRSERIAAKIDRDAVDDYLSLGYVPPIRTIYENIKTLPPGHFLTWKDDKLILEAYWTPPSDTVDVDFTDAAIETRRLLEQAVRRQMVADVPVGAFLSGGLDSSTIVALMAAETSKAVKTFSVGFGSELNELPYARAVAERYHTEHHQIDLGELQVGALLETMAQVYDEPFADSSHIPTYLICGFARRHVKVVLSGDGGDEMFGGYGRYLALAASETLGSSILMWYGLRALSRLLRERVAALHTYSVAAGMAYRWSDPAVRCAMSQVSIREPQRRSLWGKSRHLASPQHKTFVALPEAALTGLNRAFHFDLTCYLPGDILVKVDRAAMAHGLETRAPFLDRDLAEFVLRLPPGLKVRDRQTKILFRKACESLWPETIRLRRKQGFGGPYGRWFQRPDVQGLFRRVTRRNGPLRALLPGLSVQPLPPTYATWILLTLGLWLENNQNAL